MESWHVLISVQWPGAEAVGDGSQQRKEGTGVACPPGQVCILFRSESLASLALQHAIQHTRAVLCEEHWIFHELRLNFVNPPVACHCSTLLHEYSEISFIIRRNYSRSPVFRPGGDYPAKWGRWPAQREIVLEFVRNCFCFIVRCEGVIIIPCWDTGSHCPNCRRLMPWH